MYYVYTYVLAPAADTTQEVRHCIICEKKHRELIVELHSFLTIPSCTPKICTATLLSLGTLIQPGREPFKLNPQVGN